MGLVDVSAYDYGAPSGSLWETLTPKLHHAYARLEGVEACDVVVIGGGLVGLSAAWRLSEDYGAKVVLIDAAEPGWGASGRMMGLAGPSPLSAYRRAAILGPDRLRQLASVDIEAKGLVNVACEAIDTPVDQQDADLITLGVDTKIWSPMAALALEIARADGPQYEQLPAQTSGEHTADHADLPRLIMRDATLLSPLALARGMAEKLMARGVPVCANTRVRSLTPRGHRIEVHYRGGKIETAHVLIATNGQSRHRSIPALRSRVMPWPFIAVASRPISPRLLADQGITRPTVFRFEDGVLGTVTVRFMSDCRLIASVDASVMRGRIQTMAQVNNFGAWLAARFPQLPILPLPIHWRGLGARVGEGLPFIGPISDAPNISYAGGTDFESVGMALWMGRAAAMAVAYPQQAQTLPFVASEPMEPYRFLQFSFRRQMRTLDKRLLEMAAV